jgi:hypothetical protein
MSLRRVLVVLAAAAAFFVSGCAGGAADSSGGGPAITVLPSGRISVMPPLVPPSSAGAETFTGTVAEGVEPGCLVLKGTDGHHVLIFDDPAVRAQARIGARVTVSGRSMPGQATTCQQGVAFLVTTVRAD